MVNDDQQTRGQYQNRVRRHLRGRWMNLDLVTDVNVTHSVGSPGACSVASSTQTVDVTEHGSDVGTPASGLADQGTEATGDEAPHHH